MTVIFLHFNINEKKIFYARQIEKYILPANISLSYKH